MQFFQRFILPKEWTSQDSAWVLSLFGTAVGAGILFLPINAGMGGFWPLVIMTFLVWKMTYWAHRGLARLVLSSERGTEDITEVVEEHFGVRGGKILTLLYFLAIYPIVLIYGVGVTNTVEYFITNQLGFEAPPRAILSLALILGMISVLWCGEKVMLRVTQFLVYPLVTFLVVVSLYLIPYWDLEIIYQPICWRDCIKTLWMTIPVLIFSFNHSPIVSSFTQAQERDHGTGAEKKIAQILSRTATMLLGFVMLFVFSCVLSLRPEDLTAAKNLNITILSYLAHKYHTPILAYFAPPVALLAILSSFFGHYLGAKEGLEGLLVGDRSEGPQRTRKRERMVTPFLILTLWYVATVNPSILGMIEALSGPIIAVVLFLMPMYAVYRVPAMQKYRGSYTNLFVVIMGLLAISSVLYKLL